MYYTVIEIKISPRLSSFTVEKHDSYPTPMKIGSYSTLLDAEEAIQKHIFYPQTLKPIRYDARGKRMENLSLSVIPGGMPRDRTDEPAVLE